MTRKSVTELVDRFVMFKRDAQKLRPRTVESYAYTLGRFAAWCGERDPGELAWEDVDDWCNRDVRSGSGSKPPAVATLRGQTVVVSAFYKWLRDIERHPLSAEAIVVSNIRSGKRIASRPKPVPDGDWLSLWLCDLLPDDRVWLGFGYYLGFRAYEMMSIRPEEVEDDLVLDFERKGQEGANRHRFDAAEWLEWDLGDRVPTIGSTEPFVEALLWQRKAREGMRFLNPATLGENVDITRNRNEWIATAKDSQWVHRRLNILFRDNGLRLGLFTPHQLRHSAATNLYRAGTDLLRIKSLLNHKDINVTAGYADIDRAFTVQRERNLHGDRPQ